MRPPSAAPDEVRYHIVLLDARGEALADVTVTPQPAIDDAAAGSDRFATFSTTFADPSLGGTVVKVRLMRDKAILDELTPGRTGPTVTLTSPAANQSYSENLTIQWRATDPDGDDLRFNVQYSPDNGATWLALVTDYPAPYGETSHTLTLEDLTSLPGTNLKVYPMLIRVAASDGYHTAAATSGNFRVTNQPPRPSISMPPAGQVFQPRRAPCAAGPGHGRGGRTPGRRGRLVEHLTGRRVWDRRQQDPGGIPARTIHADLHREGHGRSRNGRPRCRSPWPTWPFRSAPRRCSTAAATIRRTAPRPSCGSQSSIAAGWRGRPGDRATETHQRPPVGLLQRVRQRRRLPGPGGPASSIRTAAAGPRPRATTTRSSSRRTAPLTLGRAAGAHSRRPARRGWRRASAATRACGTPRCASPRPFSATGTISSGWPSISAVRTT